MSEKKEMICIKCPLGCNLTVEKIGNELKVTGNTCNRGLVFAKEETTCPKRIVTTSVKTKLGVKSCKTTTEVPKNLMRKVVEEIEKLRLDKVEYGQIIIKNVLNTNADVVVTAND